MTDDELSRKVAENEGEDYGFSIDVKRGCRANAA